MTQFLERPGLPSLAYVKASTDNINTSYPTMVFLGGFRSDMQGTKAMFLEEKCKARGQAYVRFDYRGHGESEGIFEDACISEWADDACDIIQHCTKGPVMLVGSSMGGWISLLLSYQQRVDLHSLIGLAAAPDFTVWMEEAMQDEQLAQLESQGYFDLPNDYDDPYKITKKLIRDGRQNTLLDKDLQIKSPVRLIQGMKDMDVEWQTAHRIKNAISSDDVEVILLEEADHRLSSPDQFNILNKTVEKLLV